MLAIIILLLISFIQTSFLPIDLILLILIARSFLVTDFKSYYLAFGLGILNGLLMGQLIGSLALVYIIVIKLVFLFKAAAFSSSWLTIIPLTLILSVLNQLARLILFKSNFNFSIVLIEVGLIVPIYFLIQIWEDRFTSFKDTRLKLKR